jgi:hypothetical protein
MYGTIGLAVVIMLREIYSYPVELGFPLCENGGMKKVL